MISLSFCPLSFGNPSLSMHVKCLALMSVSTLVTPVWSRTAAFVTVERRRSVVFTDLVRPVAAEPMAETTVRWRTGRFVVGAGGRLAWTILQQDWMREAEATEVPPNLETVHLDWQVEGGRGGAADMVSAGWWWWGGSERRVGERRGRQGGRQG